MGVKSRSTDKVIKKANFPMDLGQLKGKERYCEWEFVYSPAMAPAAGTASEKDTE